MCSHTLRIDIAMRLLACIEYPLFSFARFVADKTSFLRSLLLDISSVVKIQRFLRLVKEVSSAYNSPILFLLGLWGGCQTAPQSFNHVFTSFGTITILPFFI
jgi:hypothetical protein